MLSTEESKKIDCFYEIPGKNYVEHRLNEIIHSSDFKAKEYYGFDVKRFPVDILLDDWLYNTIYQEHKFKCGITLTPPNTCYDWHTDERRGVCINMLLTEDAHSHCIFSLDRKKPSWFRSKDDTHSIIELKYKPGRRYVLNTQVQHLVFNFDKPRWTLSIEFEEDKKNLSYYDIVKLIRRLNE